MTEPLPLDESGLILGGGGGGGNGEPVQNQNFKKTYSYFLSPRLRHFSKNFQKIKGVSSKPSEK